MMGHSTKLDEVYYDDETDESRQEIILEYMKAVDALTINDEYRLRKQIAEYEDKLEKAPKVEQLQEQLANRIIEQDSIKRTVEKLQSEKELQDQFVRERERESHDYKKEIATMREQMTALGSNLQKIIMLIANSDDGIKNKFAKQMVQSDIFKPTPS